VCSDFEEDNAPFTVPWTLERLEQLESHPDYARTATDQENEQLNQGENNGHGAPLRKCELKSLPTPPLMAQLRTQDHLLM
jgi:hypothetical protein